MPWRWCWIALRRFHKDKRFRRPVLLVSFYLAYLAAYLIFGWKINREDGMGIWTVPFYGLIFGSGWLAFMLIRKVNRRSAQIFQHSLIPRPVAAEDSIRSADCQSYLFRRAEILAGLVLRAASEISPTSSDADQVQKLGIRGTVNEMLRRSRLWHQLEPEEAELLRVPDGVWTSEQKHQFSSWCEQLRLLRWTIGVDAEIEPLAHVPKPDVKLIRGILGQQQIAVRRENLVEPWELRRERDIAWEYTVRISSELIKRGLLDPDSPADSPEAVHRLHENPSTDYIAGVKTVGELDDETLWSLGASAVARYRYAAYLVDQLSAHEPMPYNAWFAMQGEIEAPK